MARIRVSKAQSVTGAKKKPSKKEAFKLLNDLTKDIPDAKKKAKVWMGPALSSHLAGKLKVQVTVANDLMKQWAASK